MLGYLVRRLFGLLPVLIGVLIVGFIIMQAPPGDYISMVQSSMQGKSISDPMRENLKENLGVGQPLPIQLWKWVKGIFTGDFGWSFTYQENVLDVIKRYIVWTFLISAVAFSLTFLLGVPLGIYSATHRYSLVDHLLTLFTFAGRSTPVFFIALLIIYIKGFWLNSSSITGLFSSEFANAPWSFAKVINFLDHLWVPVLIVTMVFTAKVLRIARNSLIEILDEAYIQTARSKGLSEATVIYSHAFRNALHELIMMGGMMLPKMITGVMVTSVVLNLPTVGYLYYESLKAQDMYLASGILFIIIALLLIGNLAADVLLGLMDPTVRYD